MLVVPPNWLVGRYIKESLKTVPNFFRRFVGSLTQKKKEASSPIYGQRRNAVRSMFSSEPSSAVYANLSGHIAPTNGRGRHGYARENTKEESLEYGCNLL